MLKIENNGILTLLCLITGLILEFRIIEAIVGGQISDSKKWPAIVSIQNQKLKNLLLKISPDYMDWTNVGKSNHICGGTLIDRQWVVTARHCLMASDFKNRCTDVTDDWKIWVGFQDQRINPSQVIDVTEIYVRNEDCSDYWTFGDITLFKLAENVSISDSVNVVGLPPTNWDESAPKSHICYGVGWGSSINLTHAIVNPLMKEIKMEIVSDCSGIYPQQILTDEICSKPDACEGPCRGDSGGPLFCSISGVEFFLSGIASRRIRDCTDCAPTLYNNVFMYNDAINGIIHNNFALEEIKCRFGFTKVGYSYSNLTDCRFGSSFSKRLTVSLTTGLAFCCMVFFNSLYYIVYV